MSLKRPASELEDSDRDKRPNKRPAFDFGAFLSSSLQPLPKTATDLYKNGALRITRTPGRLEERVNTVALDEIILHEYLNSVFVASFYIEDDYFFKFFPLKEPNFTNDGRAILSHDSTRYRPSCKVYISRDINMDSCWPRPSGNNGTTSPLSDAQFASAVEHSQKMYQNAYGANFVACYPRMKAGCSHSKIMLLEHSQFLRVVITSANMMKLDTELGDNQWFIQDFKRLPNILPKSKYSSFETRLWEHAKALAAPTAFIDSLAGRFDFSTAKGTLVISQPKNLSTRPFAQDENAFGIFRMKQAVKQIFKKQSSQLSFEICSASLGHLRKEVVQNFLDALGAPDCTLTERRLKFVFPTRTNVQQSLLGEEGACNVSCHTRWSALDEATRESLHSSFYQYRSCDPMRPLFHLKSILALDETGFPAYIYVGSANFSINAWGSASSPRKAPSNMECGIIVEGSRITSMVESSNWETILPYTRPCKELLYTDADRAWVTHAYSIDETTSETRDMDARKLLDELSRVIPGLKGIFGNANPDRQTIMEFAMHLQSPPENSHWVY